MTSNITEPNEPDIPLPPVKVHTVEAAANSTNDRGTTPSSSDEEEVVDME